MTAIGITGHQAIPGEAVALLEEEVGRRLRAAGGAVLGITSLAAGADQLFARLVLQAGGEI
ncbi:MAG TPA: hypothetical protein VFR37_03105, partial [Longimicrobium sp.]|nr:hypothetical protein [Longimicrobium sp.]